MIDCVCTQRYRSVDEFGDGNNTDVEAICLAKSINPNSPIINERSPASTSTIHRRIDRLVTLSSTQQNNIGFKHIIVCGG